MLFTLVCVFGYFSGGEALKITFFAIHILIIAVILSRRINSHVAVLVVTCVLMSWFVSEVRQLTPNISLIEAGNLIRYVTNTDTLFEESLIKEPFIEKQSKTIEIALFWRYLSQNYLAELNSKNINNYDTLRESYDNARTVPLGK